MFLIPQTSRYRFQFGIGIRRFFTTGTVATKSLKALHEAFFELDSGSHSVINADLDVAKTVQDFDYFPAITA